MNKTLNPIMVKLHEAKATGRRAILDKEEISELYLYYIAISRARYRVNNGIHAVGSDIKPQPGGQ